MKVVSSGLFDGKEIGYYHFLEFAKSEMSKKAKSKSYSLDKVKTLVCILTIRHCRSSCASGVDIDRVVRDAKRIFCNTPRTASMRRHDRLFADPNVKHVSQSHLPLFQRETFVICFKQERSTILHSDLHILRAYEAK